MTTPEQQALQSFYDRACAGVIQQGKASINPGGGCLYRFEDGENVLKCPVGHVLTDAQIKEFGVREGDSADEFHSDLIIELLPGVHESRARYFLDRLQGAHDQAAGGENFLEDFKTRAHLLGSELGLKVNF